MTRRARVRWWTLITIVRRDHGRLLHSVVTVPSQRKRRGVSLTLVRQLKRHGALAIVGWDVEADGRRGH